ncbi:MAG: cytosine deaminase [Pigmentiphaga sp.]|uniref:cytosine deaminase n=1 Tax=Pigmentiphaga sp. TaxID=1977564 RepID=UPI0029A4E36B|nr:cytosine deaminase [Pigmentiphaga sp.]MDX3904479.1 cytosine deaminase [Pigmentiphaga sp.]
MSATSFFDMPRTARYALRWISLPECLAPAGLPPAMRGGRPIASMVQADMLIEDGRIAAIQPAGTLPAAMGPDLGQSMVLPGMPDVHAHLDKGHIWPRMPNPTGDAVGAAMATSEDRSARWTAEDVERRMEFGLMTAYAKGVVAIRTHLDSLAPQAAISFPVFETLRARWAGRIDLQVSSIAPLDLFLTDEGRQLADTVAHAQGQLGCMTRFRSLPNVPMPPEFDQAMGNLFRLAAERGLDVDLHVDESGDREARTLLRVAELARRDGFEGDILCGHCCSLSLQDDDVIEATLDACVQARVDIVTLPAVNLYLQSRQAGVTPRWRGVTLLHEMKARGLRVAIAGDNCRDPFYAYGDHDMLETFSQAVKILHLDHPLGDWIRAATATPAEIMGLPQAGRIAPGAPADLIVLRARDYSEMLSRFQSDRVVLRAGQAIDTTLPDYRMLDDLMAA